jgi:hypothetical protein
MLKRGCSRFRSVAGQLCERPGRRRTTVRRSEKSEKPDARGGRFLLLPHCLLTSEAYRTASPRCLKALTVLCLRHTGFNNGRIGLSLRDLARGMDSQNHGANARAVGELIARGILAVERVHPRGSRLANEYRLTFIPSRAGPATHDYLAWQSGDSGSRRKPRPPGKKRPVKLATEGRSSVAETATVAKFRVVGLTDEEAENGPSLPIPTLASFAETAAHIIASGARQEKSDRQLRKIPGGAPSAAPEAEELRERVQATLSELGRGWQGRLAERAAVPAGTLSRFLRGGPMNHQARIRLSCAIPRIKQMAQANDRAA